MRAHVPNQELIAMTSDPEHIVRNHADLSFHANVLQEKARHEAMQELKESAELPLEADTEDSPSKPVTGQDIAPAINPFISDPTIRFPLFHFGEWKFCT